MASRPKHPTPVHVRDKFWADLRFAWPTVSTSAYLGIGPASLTIATPAWYTVVSTNAPLGVQDFTLAAMVSFATTLPAGTQTLLTTEGTDFKNGFLWTIASGAVSYAEKSRVGATTTTVSLSTFAGSVQALVITRTCSTMAAYLNGIMVASNTNVASWFVGNPLCMGCLPDQSQVLSAGMSDVYIFNRALLPVEVAQFYKDVKDVGGGGFGGGGVSGFGELGFGE